MGFYSDFLDCLLGDNVMDDYEKLVRSMRTNESQSQISNNDWKHRQQYCRRTEQIKQKQIMRTYRNYRMRTK